MANWIIGKLVSLYISMMNYQPLMNITIPMFDMVATLIGAVPTAPSATLAQIPSGTSKSVITINKDSAADWVKVNDNVMGGISTSNFSVK